MATRTKAAIHASTVYNRTSESLKKSAIRLAVDCSVETTKIGNFLRFKNQMTMENN